MIGRLNHVGIATPSLEQAVAIYRASGLEVSKLIIPQGAGVKVLFVKLPNTELEFIEPLDASSPLTNFLARRPDGGLHHVCYEVDDIHASTEFLVRQGASVIGDGSTRIGAHGKPVLFLKPKAEFSGALVELQQA